MINTLSWPLVLICWYFNQPINKVLSTDRSPDYVKVRQVVQYIGFVSGMTYEQAGELTGHKMETARHSVRQVRDKITTLSNGITPDLKMKTDIETLLR